MTKENNNIREVWASNFEQEIMIITELIDKYPYIAMDTEFPGTIHSANSKLKDGTYQGIKANVDDLKLIQFGLTLTDERGNQPTDCATWQFNLKFDIKEDKHNIESINLLSNSGINFDKLSELGIDPSIFGSVLTTSGIVLNEEIKWITFHGSYDFAYLVKLLTNLTLPETEQGFFDLLKIYFPTFFDIRHLTRNLEGFSKSLQKLAMELNVNRIGTQHQAGSDALVTSRVFHKITSTYLTTDTLKGDENVLFGIGLYYEDEFATIIDGHMLNQLNLNSMNSMSNMNTVNSMSGLGNLSNVNTIPNIGINSMNYTNQNQNNNSNNPSNNNSINLTNSTKIPSTQYDMNYYHQYGGYNNMGNTYFRSNPTYNYSYSQYNPNYGYSMPNDYMMTGMNNNVPSMNTMPGMNSLSNMTNMPMSSINPNMMNNSNNEEFKKRSYNQN